MNTEFLQRRRALLSQIAKVRLASLLVMNPKHWYYLTGFTGESGALIISRRGAALITDGRFLEQARQETSGVRVLLQDGSLLSSIGKFLKGQRGGRVGFGPSQLTIAQFRGLRKAAGRAVRWVAADGQVEGLRAKKTPFEISQMRRAAHLAGDVLEGAIKLLKPGVREIEIGAEIEYQMRRRGASGPAFETIVAFGERSAYPHARPTAKRLKKNELVVLDLGAILAHYCSDITRTVFVGRASPRIRQWYRAVQEAQEAARAAVKAGVRGGDVDSAARRVLAAHKLDRYFTHSTGHGLGLEVHEEPRLARGQKQTLEPGNVVTIEPGVYVPGIGGIRIEDDIVVHEDQAEVLTRVPRDFIEI
jgi:Xaa-Pro aminopeptidase